MSNSGVFPNFHRNLYSRVDHIMPIMFMDFFSAMGPKQVIPAILNEKIKKTEKAEEIFYPVINLLNPVQKMIDSIETAHTFQVLTFETGKLKLRPIASMSTTGRRIEGVVVAFMPFSGDGDNLDSASCRRGGLQGLISGAEESDLGGGGARAANLEVMAPIFGDLGLKIEALRVAGIFILIRAFG